MNRENDHQFMMIERWQSALMLEKHTQATPFNTLVHAIDGMAELQVTSLISAV